MPARSTVVYSTPKKSQIKLKKTSNSSVKRKHSNDTGANIKVVIRVRPENEKEIKTSVRNVVKTLDHNMLIFDPKEEEEAFFYKGVKQKCRDITKKNSKNMTFVFDSVLGKDATNEEVFCATTRDIVDAVLNGFNCSIFAYGATGSGKTFTMIGSQTEPGIIFLTVMELYKKISETSDYIVNIRISYLEVYNESVKDLLQSSEILDIREDHDQEIKIPGLSIHKPENAEELLEMLHKGNCCRSQHPTDYNAQSSRSHAVFQVYVQQQARNPGTCTNMKMAKLCFIDLAGSEKGSATGFIGARFREGGNINKSLLALGNCINALADGQKFVPYRNSKLTRLLKDSLGGNCRTVMIAAISPCSNTFEDTHNTLKYANRAKQIKSQLHSNVISVQLHLSQYPKLVNDLQKQIEMLQNQINVLENESCKSLCNTCISTQTENMTENICPDVAFIDPCVSSSVAVLKHSETQTEYLDFNQSITKQSTNAKEIIFKNSQSQTDFLVENCCNLPLESQKSISDAFTTLGSTVLQLLSCEKQEKEAKLKILQRQANSNRLNQISIFLERKNLSIQKAYDTIHSLQAKISRLHLRKQQLNNLLINQENLIHKLEAFYFSEAKICKNSLNYFIQCKKLELQLLNQNFCLQHALHAAELREIDIQHQEQLLLSLLEKIKDQHLLLKGSGLLSQQELDMFKSLVAQVEGNKCVCWADQDASVTDKASQVQFFQLSNFLSSSLNPKKNAEGESVYNEKNSKQLIPSIVTEPYQPSKVFSATHNKILAPETPLCLLNGTRTLSPSMYDCAITPLKDIVSNNCLNTTFTENNVHTSALSLFFAKSHNMLSDDVYVPETPRMNLTHQGTKVNTKTETKAKSRRVLKDANQFISFSLSKNVANQNMKKLKQSSSIVTKPTFSKSRQDLKENKSSLTCYPNKFKKTLSTQKLSECL